MEESSKALFMAASVCIGVLLLTIMIYVFSQGAKVNAVYDKNQISNQLELYNARFEVFDRSTNNIIDIISLANLAYSTNAACDFDPTVGVSIAIEIGEKDFYIKSTLRERNKILKGATKISIYNLAYLSLEDLGVNNASSIGAKANKLDKLSKTKLINGHTYYKYLFKVENSTDFKYHPNNGKVSEIKLKAYVNMPLNDHGHVISNFWDE